MAVHQELTDIHRGTSRKDVTPNVLISGGYARYASDWRVKSQTFLESLTQELKVAKILVFQKLMGTKNGFNFPNNSAKKINKLRDQKKIEKINI